MSSTTDLLASFLATLIPRLHLEQQFRVIFSPKTLQMERKQDTYRSCPCAKL